MHEVLLRWQQRLHDPSLVALLLLQLVVLFAVEPLAALGLPVPRPLVLAFILAVTALVVVVSPHRWAIVSVLISLVISAIGLVERIRDPSAVSEWLGGLGGVLALMAVSWVVASAVFAPGPITTPRILGAVVLYLNIAMTFTALYRLLEDLSPGAFLRPTVLAANTSVQLIANLVYFSLTTLTTTGFGDIVPVHPVARSLAMLEAVIGQIYPAVVLARIVTLTGQPRE